MSKHSCASIPHSFMVNCFDMGITLLLWHAAHNLLLPYSTCPDYIQLHTIHNHQHKQHLTTFSDAWSEGQKQATSNHCTITTINSLLVGRPTAAQSWGKSDVSKSWRDLPVMAPTVPSPWHYSHLRNHTTWLLVYQLKNITPKKFVMLAKQVHTFQAQCWNTSVTKTLNINKFLTKDSPPPCIIL